MINDQKVAAFQWQHVRRCSNGVQQQSNGSTFDGVSNSIQRRSNGSTFVGVPKVADSTAFSGVRWRSSVFFSVLRHSSAVVWVSCVLGDRMEVWRLRWSWVVRREIGGLGFFNKEIRFLFKK
uniref:Uncharacterized protein n=1 Tax=Cucumis melo TaxID=3656 RepID=A0A9I9DML6_CUCME